MHTRVTAKGLHAGIALVLLALINLFAVAACGVLEVGVEPISSQTPAPQAMDGGSPTVFEGPTPTVAAGLTATASQGVTVPLGTRETATAVASVPTATQTPKATVSSSWIEYRDPRYGYGLALPCFWVIFPGVGAPSIMSYDEAFLRAHSARGYWLNNEWPQGAVKIDVGVLGDVDPSLSLAEAAQQRLTNERQYVHSTKEVTIGAHPVVLAEVRDSEDASVSYTVPVFQLSPEHILFLSVMPRSALASPDVQAIIGSLALSPEQAVAIPSTPPGEPVEGREVYVDEEAGYCFAYPSTFEMGEVRPGQPGLVGPELEEDAVVVRPGLTIQVGDVPVDSTLAELTNAFVGEMPDASVTRQPFRLYGEPAEMIEHATGREGARKVCPLAPRH